MPEIICEDCGKILFHENHDTLKIEKKFCRKKEGETQSYMHRERSDQSSMDAERQTDQEGKPIIKK